MANINDTGKITYSIVGRYMNGSAVSSYHIIGSDGKELKASRELICYLVGKGVVSNCKGQMNGGDVVLRGVGVSLTEIPVKNERTGRITRTDNLGEVKPKNLNDSQIFTQLIIVGRLFNENKCVGYIVRDAGGTEKKLERSVVIKLASERRIGNARINMDNGVQILRGVGVELDKLPVTQLANMQKETNTIQKKNTADDIRKLKVSWYEVEGVMTKLESRFQKDTNNNASGIYQYPVLELMANQAAVMVVRTSDDLYKVTQIRRGTNTKYPEYGLEFIMSNTDKKIRVVCDDISILAFNIHVLGFIAITALLKMDRESSVREFMFENKIERLVWREYTTIKNTNTFKIDKEKNWAINEVDIVRLQNNYNIELNPLSSLGDRNRHPTINMVSKKTAIMGINTSLGYYEVGRVRYGFNSNIGIALEVVNKSTGDVHLVTMNSLEKNRVTTKNISIICCAALLKYVQQIEVKDIIIENEAEGSVVGYQFIKK